MAKPALFIKRDEGGEWLVLSESGEVLHRCKRHEQAWRWIDKTQREDVNASEKRHEWGTMQWLKS